MASKRKALLKTKICLKSYCRTIMVIMTTEEIANNLIGNAQPVKEVKSFSSKPGIYALFFLGDSFPLEDYQLSENRVIYIGKTIKSQQSRDANTHFKTGKSGGSTIRVSIGALLSKTETMVPVIRSMTDIENRRKSLFKFDDASENEITEWMNKNLGVSFFECSGSAREIDTLETDIIQLLKPVLNIDRKNHDNPNKAYISSLRKKLRTEAFKPYQHLLNSKKGGRILETGTKVNISIAGKYLAIWETYLPEIAQAIRLRDSQAIQLDKNLFHSAGNRQKYSFQVKYNYGVPSKNLSGAVARDLDKVLKRNNVCLSNVFINLTKDFELIIHPNQI